MVDLDKRARHVQPELNRFDCLRRPRGTYRYPGPALSALTARLTVLLSNGTVLLGDGVTSLILGQVTTVAAAPVDVLFKAQLAA
jgi:hypothetical protein